MTLKSRRTRVAALLAVLALPVISIAEDWPYWGKTASRNMVSSEVNIPTDWSPGAFKQNSEEIDLTTAKNIRWVEKLGSQAYGNATIANGKVLVGTNNESARDPRLKGDRGVVMCFDEKTGKFLWQLAAPKLGTGKVSDWEFLGICSSPAIDGDKVYIVTNRCEVMCLDLNGMANGNDGAFKDEAQYNAGPGKPPIPAAATDADILWVYDMRKELGIFPHNITNCAPLIIGNKVVVTTSNGVDWTHTNIPNPKAPALAMFDKNTGELLGEEDSGVSSRTLHSNWSSAAGGKINGKDVIIFGGGDGICYCFSAEETIEKEGSKILKELWRFDANPPEYRVKNGKNLKYATPEGPSEIIATPVLIDNKVYVPIGQDPEHGEGIGNMVCIDATKTGDITKTGAIWQNRTIMRSLSTPAIFDGLLYVGDYSGFIHCYDAATGKEHWKYDTKSHIWGSPLVVEGKVYVGTEDGDVVILQAGKEMTLVNKVDMKAPIYSSPVVANGTLYVSTPTHLYAVATK
jgi:outer membrane protein assembly factor BamB